MLIIFAKNASFIKVYTSDSCAHAYVPIIVGFLLVLKKI